MANWAKHLRGIKVEFNPFVSGKTPTTFFAYAASKRVRAEAPKLTLEKKILPRSSEAQLLHLTFVDGGTKTLDVSQMSTADVLLEVESENGRLDTEAMIRGKPWK